MNKNYFDRNNDADKKKKARQQDFDFNVKGKPKRYQADLKRDSLYADKLHNKAKSVKTPKVINVTESNIPSKKKKRKSRNNIVTISIIVIVVFFLAMLFLLYNQSQTLKISYENAELKSQISELQKKNSEKKERLGKEVNVDEVAKKAKKLGFQYPKDEQIVKVKQEEKDSVILFNDESNANGVSSYAVDMDEIFTNIEDYILAYEEGNNGQTK